MSSHCNAHWRRQRHRADVAYLSAGHCGVTLVELIIALAAIALLATIALPSFAQVMQRLRADTAIHQLHAHLTMTRSAAVTRRVPVTLCPSRGDGLCSNDSDWSHGWLMYRDRHRRNQPESPADILRQTDAPIHSSLRLISSQARPRVRFLASGRSSGSNLTIRVCRQSELLGEVIVNNVGRVRAARHRPPHACTD